MGDAGIPGSANESFVGLIGIDIVTSSLAEEVNGEKLFGGDGDAGCASIAVLSIDPPISPSSSMTTGRTGSTACWTGFLGECFTGEYLMGEGCFSITTAGSADGIVVDAFTGLMAGESVRVSMSLTGLIDGDGRGEG